MKDEKFEQLYREELDQFTPKLKERVESAIASIEFETDDFTFQEKYEILKEVREEESELNIKNALSGVISTSELSAEEQEVFFEKLFILMQKKTTPEQETAFQAYIKNN